MTKARGLATNVKIAIVTALSTITVALIGAWQVAASTTPNSDLTRGEVRQMIQNESPVNARGANELFQTLIRIDNNVTQIKVNEAVDHALIQQLAAQASRNQAQTNKNFGR